MRLPRSIGRVGVAGRHQRVRQGAEEDGEESSQWGRRETRKAAARGPLPDARHGCENSLAPVELANAAVGQDHRSTIAISTKRSLSPGRRGIAVAVWQPGPILPDTRPGRGGYDG